MVAGRSLAPPAVLPARGTALVESAVEPIRAVYLVVGVGLLAVTVLDLLWTTLWVDGGSGPLSSRLTTAVWQGLRRIGGSDSRLLGLAGPIILSLTLVTWVGLIWIGWTLVFGGSQRALIDTSTGGNASWVGRFYFVAYSMFTMGNGDFSPNGSLWQIATSLTTASGMLFVTMGVSYVLSVLGAVVDKRSFAGSVTGMGAEGEDVVETGWSGDGFDGLPLDSLATDLNRLAQQHKAYPILHYYHSESHSDASAVSVVVFDEALTLLRFGVSEEQRPAEARLEGARSSVEDYLQTLNNAFIEPADRTPPSPDLDRLRAAGVPTVSDEAFDEALGEQERRRRKLLGMITADAWRWPPRNDD